MVSERLKTGLEVADVKAIEALSKRRFEIIQYGTNFRIVLIGESHRLEDLEEQQREIIKLVKPNYVLDEKLRDWTYDPKDKTFKKKDGRIVDKVGDMLIPITPGHLVYLANELNFQLIGCDLNEVEISNLAHSLPKWYPRSYKLNGDTVIRMSNKEYTPLSSSKLHQDPNVMMVRDRHMTKTALKYERISPRPVIQIVGAAHGRNISEGGLLTTKTRGCLYIDQVPRWG